MNIVWILVCDAAKARLFEIRQGDPSWHPVELVMHEASRSKASELVSDKAGSRSSEGGSVHHNALAPGSSPKNVEKDHFAHSLATTLDRALRATRFQNWVLVAPPHFLGLMKKELGSELAKSLMATVDKDLTGLDIHALAERLHGAVRIPVNNLAAIRENTKHVH
jgi:protein required for attachment to host cells